MYIPCIEPINYHNVLSNINEHSLYREIIGDFKIGKPILSPLREETNPSFCVFNHKGKLFWKDFGSGESGDIIKFLRLVHNTDFNGVIAIISNNQIQCNIVYQSIQKEQKENKWIVEYKKDYQKNELEYYAQYNIPKHILRLFEIKSINKIKTDKWIFSRKESDIVVGWTHNNKWKIYSPMKEKHLKFVGNVSKDLYQGDNHLPIGGDLLVITKSMKDVMCLRCYDIYSVAPQSESQLLNKEKIEDYRNRFNNIVLMFDNDKVGREWSEKNSKEFGLQQVFTEDKDFSDTIKNKGNIKPLVHYLHTL